MAKRRTEAEDESYLLKALIMIVDKLERNTNNKVNPPVKFRGVLDKAVKDVFFGILIKKEHPMAWTINTQCTAENPCGECREDVFRSVVAAAVEQKQIAVLKKAKWDVFLSREEMVEFKHPANNAALEAVLQEL